MSIGGRLEPHFLSVIAGKFLNLILQDILEF
jgi:hypothetical protein